MIVTSGPTPAWTATYDNLTGNGSCSQVGFEIIGSCTEYASGVALSPNGQTAYITGTSWDDLGTQADIATVAYDTSSGRAQWISRYNGPENLDDVGLNIAVSPDGSRVYVTGNQGWCFSCDATSLTKHQTDSAVTVAYDAATGRQLWSRSLSSPNTLTGLDQIVPSADGTTLYVAGGRFTQDPSPDSRTLVIAYDAATGSQRWLQQYQGESADIFDMKLSPDGSHLFVTGDGFLPAPSPVYPGTNITELLTVAYSAASGEQAWVAHFHTDSDGQALSLAVTSTGVFVTGWANFNTVVGGAADAEYATIGYGARTGRQLWLSRYGPTRNAQAVALVASPSGDRVYVTGGSVPSSATGSSVITIAYDTIKGRPIWITGERPSPLSTEQDVRSLAVSPDGHRVYIAGDECSKQGCDMRTVALETAAGGVVWTALLNTSPLDDDLDGPVGQRSCAVSPDGSRVLVAGVFARILGPNTEDYGTVAYDR